MSYAAEFYSTFESHLTASVGARNASEAKAASRRRMACSSSEFICSRKRKNERILPFSRFGKIFPSEKAKPVPIQFRQVRGQTDRSFFFVD